MVAQTKIESVKFGGASGTIPVQLFTPGAAFNKLAVVLPGAAYSFREPLLRYPIQILLKKGYRVLALDKVYGDDPAWRDLSSETEARKIVEEDTVKIFEQIKLKFSEPNLLFGRSLGTFAMGCLLENNLVSPEKLVWQTPALGSKWAVMRDCKIPGFGILGTADHYYQIAIENMPKDRIVIKDADHAMEIPGQPVQSIDILKQVMMAVDQWI